MIFPCSSDSRPLTDGNIVEDHVELTVNDWNLTNHRGYETRFETNRFKGIKYDFTKKSVSWKYLKIGRALHPRVNHCVRSIKSVAFGRHVPQFQIRSYGHMVMLILMITIWSPSDHHRRDPTDCQHYHQAKQSGFPEDANIGKHATSSKCLDWYSKSPKWFCRRNKDLLLCAMVCTMIYTMVCTMIHGINIVILYC